MEGDGEKCGETGESDGIILGDFEEGDEVGAGGGGGDGLFDDADAHEEEAEGEDDLSDAAVAALGRDLHEEDADEDEDGGVAFEGDGDELDGEGEADIGAEHDDDHLAGGDVAGLDGIDGEHGHGRGGGSDGGGGETCEKGAGRLFGDAASSIRRGRRAEDTVEAFTEVAGGEDEERNAAGYEKKCEHVWGDLHIVRCRRWRGGFFVRGVFPPVPCFSRSISDDWLRRSTMAARGERPERASSGWAAGGGIPNGTLSQTAGVAGRQALTATRFVLYRLRRLNQS